jgi:hypothetical protein
MEPEDHSKLRSCNCRNKPFPCELSRIGRLGPMCRGHSKRNVRDTRTTWQSLESIDIARAANVALPATANLSHRSDLDRMGDTTDSPRLYAYLQLGCDGGRLVKPLKRAMEVSNRRKFVLFLLALVVSLPVAVMLYSFRDYWQIAGILYDSVPEAAQIREITSSC